MSSTRVQPCEHVAEGDGTCAKPNLVDGPDAAIAAGANPEHVRAALALQVRSTPADQPVDERLVLLEDTKFPGNMQVYCMAEWLKFTAEVARGEYTYELVGAAN
jgi:hypothetical protein